MYRLLIFTGCFILLSLGLWATWEPSDEKPAPKPEKPTEFSVGQWVKYQIKRYARETDLDTNKPEGIKALSESNLKLSVIKKEIIPHFGKEEFVWVEFLINENKEQERIIKFMIDKAGIPQPEVLILKYGNLEAVEINLRWWELKTRIRRSTLFEEMTGKLNIIPFTRLIDPEEETTTEKIALTLNGKETTLECIKVFFDIPDSDNFGYVWYSNQIPLAGLVKFFLVEDEYRTMILLSEYSDSGGRSVITKPTKKLNFREPR